MINPFHDRDAAPTDGDAKPEPKARRVTAKALDRYRKVVRLAAESPSEGERKAAEAAMRRIEAAFPTISAALKRVDAEQRAAEDRAAYRRTSPTPRPAARPEPTTTTTHGVVWQERRSDGGQRVQGFGGIGGRGGGGRGGSGRGPFGGM